MQLSSVELQTEVQEVLESNMMLELDEGEESEQHETTLREKSDDGDENHEINTDEIPEDLPVDSVWEDIYDAGPVYSPGNDSGVYENPNVDENSLYNHLLWQLNLTQVGERDKAIAIAIIDSLDNDGYLTMSLDEVRESLGNDIEIENDEVEAVLHLVQALEPTGIAARDLRECLLLQLQQCPKDTPFLDKAMEIVDRHLQLMAARDFNQLMRRLKVDRETLQHTISLIQTMNPRPASQIQPAHTEYIIPDVYVKKEKDAWKVELNSDSLPRLKINMNYAGMIRRADNSADNTSLKNHLQEARWFIKSLQSRNETLLRVASCIVEKQRAFLEHGEEAMKPLVLHDIAELLGLHESTISRVLCN